MAKKLTNTQKARIYCVKYGHAQYVSRFWGYVHCGRCGDQIGDQLASCFDTTKLMVIGCKEKDCKVCPAVKKTLNEMDLKILANIEANEKDIYKGVKFPEEGE